jgi:sentrin-specific protease 1
LFSPSSPLPCSLGFQQYVELVNSVSHPAPSTPAATTDATRQAVPLEVVAIEEEEEGEEEEEDEDERKQQDEEEVRGSVVVRRVPQYKELYEKSRKRDAKLKTLEFEVRLAQVGRLSLERLAEALPRITPKKEVLLSWILLHFFVSYCFVMGCLCGTRWLTELN